MCGIPRIQRCHVYLQIHLFFLLSRHGKVRLKRTYATMSVNKTRKLIAEATTLVLQRKAKMTNVLDWKGYKLVYKRYEKGRGRVDRPHLAVYRVAYP